MKRYTLAQWGRALIETITPSGKAPFVQSAPMQNSPTQSVTTAPFPRDTVDNRPVGPARVLFDWMHLVQTVKTIEVRQPVHFPSAPNVPIAPKVEGIADQRLGIMQYPADNARASYVYGALSAPDRLQSVPGYTIKQSQITQKSVGYPTQAMRAPRARIGGGQCQDG